MNTGIARGLRRFAGVAAMMLAGQAGVHDLLFPGSALPSRDVDRVVVLAGDEPPREITDRATVRRIVRLVRSGDDGIRTRQLCLAPGLNVTFFRGTEPRGGIAFDLRVMRVPARHDDVIIPLAPADAAELSRLLRIAHR